MSPDTQRACDVYRAAVAAGEDPSAIVGQLAAWFDVQRPAIWKRLRRGGAAPEYRPRQSNGAGRPIGGGQPGYSDRRRQKALADAAARRTEPRPEQFVDRDPCPRCGVRGDIGCGHSRAPLGTVL